MCSKMSKFVENAENKKTAKFCENPVKFPELLQCKMHTVSPICTWDLQDARLYERRFLRQKTSWQAPAELYRMLGCINTKEWIE